MLFYHATHVSNLQSILQRGIRPRTPDFYDKLLERLANEYELDYEQLARQEYPPPSEGFYGILREEMYMAKRYRSGEVSLSGNSSYALQNSLAGYEVEFELRKQLERLIRFRATGVDPFEVDTRAFWRAYDDELYERTVANWHEGVLFEVDLNLSDLRARDQQAIRGLVAEGLSSDELTEIRVSLVPPEKIVDWRLLSKLRRV